VDVPVHEVYINEAEDERLDFEEDSHKLDDFLISQIEECTEAVLEMIRQDHRPEFALFYGREIFIETHERSMYNATEALREFGNENGDADIVFNDAYSTALKQGRSIEYAQRYAMAMNDEPWEANAHASAQAYEDAWNEALAENQDMEYCRKFAEMVGYMDYNRSYCKLYAETYLEACKLYSDESDREQFTEYFSREYFNYACRHEDPELDEFYYYDKAVAHVYGSRFERELGIKGFSEKYVELYINAFPDYPAGSDDPALKARNVEIAKEKSIEYFSRAAQRQELAKKLRRD
jgi:hypothetical protein